LNETNSVPDGNYVPEKKGNKETTTREQDSDGPVVNGSAINGKAAVSEKSSGSSEKKPDLDYTTYSKTAKHYPWQNIGGFNEGKKFDRSLIADAHLVKNYINETYYSDLYWNMALIVGTCIFSWLIATLRFGIFGLVIVLLTTASFYKAEFRRFKRNVRDDLQRIHSAEKLEDNFESMEWLNSFLVKFWVIYMPALSDTVRTIANDTLKDVAPGYGIEALTLDEFNLGSKSPRIDSIKSYTKKGKQLVEWDWAFSFTPDDTSDMTKRQIDRKVNPKVALGVRVGKAFISKSLPILVENMSITGRVKITLNLALNFPHVKIVSVQLLEPPKIDFALKPVGGDTFGLDIMSLIPGLSTLITTLINSNVGPMLYAPNHLDIDVEELVQQQSNDATGVVALTVKGADNLSDSINPYFQIAVDSEPQKNIRTSVKAQTKEPRWNETEYILLNNLQQKLNFELYDFNIKKKKGELYASHEFDLAELLQQDTHIDISKPLSSSGKKKGTVNYDIRWFPALDDENSSESDEGNEIEIPDSEVGIFKFTLHEAKGLDNTLSLTGQLNPKADLYINGELKKSFRTLKRSNEPSWEESLEVLVTQKANTQIRLVLSDGSTGTEIGVLTESLDTLTFNVTQGEDRFPLSTQGKVHVSAVFKPVSLSGVSPSAGYIAPLGVIRLHLRNARDALNLEKVGKVDPYVKVLLANRLKYKTSFHPDTLDPEFNEVTYIPITSESQTLTLELMDDQNMSKDRTLGSTNIAVIDVLKKGPNGSFLFYDGSGKVLTSSLQRKDKKPKGEISYSVSFLPTIPVYSLDELRELEERKEQIAAKKEKQAQDLKDWEALYKEKPAEHEWVEVEDFDEEDDGTKKEKFSLEQLLTYRSGVLSIHFESGKVKKPESFVQVLLDDFSHPSFVTSKTNARTVNPEVGDAFIRDLPNSRIIFRNTKKPDVKDSEQIYDEASFNTIDLLKKAYDKPTTLTVGSTQLKVRFEYIPSAIKLPPSETILDTGRAQIEFLDAENLLSADRNGKSDPFVSVSLGGTELFKSKVVKKTLNPTWNEGTTLPIPSRCRSDLELKVFDWDRAAKNDLIGTAKLDISKVQPLHSEIVHFQLNPQGSVRARVTFSPEYIRPQVGERQYGLSVSGLAGVPLKGVAAAGSLATGAVGGGIHVAGNVLGAGAGAAGKGGSLFKSVLGKKSKQSMDQPRQSTDTHADDIKSARSGRSKPQPDSNSQMTMPSPEHSRSSSQVTTYSNVAKDKKATKGHIVVKNGLNLGSKAQLKVSLGIKGKLKHIYTTRNTKSSNGTITWEEEIEFEGPQDAEVVFGAVVHHTLGKDHELGTASIKLSDVIDNPQDITLTLGQGKITVNFKYSPEPTSTGETPPPEGW
jgi:Ca2+-dependent lipid-binding protein